MQGNSGIHLLRTYEVSKAKEASVLKIIFQIMINISEVNNQ